MVKYIIQQYNMDVNRAEQKAISEYALRQLVKQGKVPCIALEHKVLINFDAFVEQLHHLKGVF